ncbi:alpha/beta fold hydrolase [Actinomadura atramentaria]|uniref:alpha/beta fold hydrolase n=1 Tax=Actinomadura atramentaria TaxID=1990 RepID=UPI000381A84A|nr:alpha/beta fold hydrolase [Actinomadura atramentaria]
MKTRRIKNQSVKLAIREYDGAGAPGAPTIVLVHGYPDDQDVWTPVAARLAERFRVVTYDVRGAGGSTRPRRTREYAMEHLAADLRAVADAVSPDRPVHLVGHDWGSVQGWGALTGGALTGRVASFTSISGPCIEHFGQWVRDRLRRPTPRHVRDLAGQFARSWYLIVGAVPGVAQLVWRLGGTRLFPVLVERTEGVSRPDRPGFRKDALSGVKLYKANAVRFLRPGWTCTTNVPVQVIAPTRDRFVSPRQSLALAPYADRLWRRELDAGHWGAVLAEPERVADWVAEFVRHVEGGPEPAGLAAARVPSPTRTEAVAR